MQVILSVIGQALQSTGRQSNKCKLAAKSTH